MHTPVLLCLHGWGGSKESFTELRAALEGCDLDIVTPDLPGFGGEPEPKQPWTVDDYASWIEDYAKAHGITHCHLLGHSHGGRIALKIASRGNVMIDHLYLCAAAGIKRGRHMRRIVGLTLAKTGKTILSLPGIRSLSPEGKKLLYKIMRVHDYEKASEVMRKTMINVSREDLRPLLSSIKIPTDIFWGTRDRMTPYADAKVMRQGITGSHLHTFPGEGHRIHRSRAGEIAGVIRARISDT